MRSRQAPATQAPQSGLALGQTFGEMNPEFLAALPPEMREELLQQERMVLSQTAQVLLL